MMTEVTFDDSSLLVNGRRVWLVSGSVHYFRVPSALWRDRLLKAKRAGLNCVSTYVAWNFHEPHEGDWHLEGDHDIASFVRLAGELGLYVILRPGPYICAEWDFGGLPAWLTAKQGIAYRTNNAAYTHYYDKYFARVLPQLAQQQVTRGGNIVLIQNENEYFMTTMPDRLGYLEFITRLFRRSGFDIPVINCNIFSDPPVPDTIECVNTWDRAVQDLKRMRDRQPGAPLLITEFRGGWYDYWGGEHQKRDAREVARRALEAVGCGAQYNYYMWHGGTNFGFWGSRLNVSDSSYQTTSYDYDAPLAEGGGLTGKYYLTRLVNMFANHMGRFLASCHAELPDVTIHDATSVLNLSGPSGEWAIVTNNGRDDIQTVGISLPSGTDLTVSLAPLGAVAIPVDLELTAEHTLDYSNLMPLGLFGDARKVLVLHGPAGFAARVSINGDEISAEVPKGDEPKVIDHQGLRVVLADSDLAMRTWLVEDTLVFGPKFVGETLEDLLPARGTKQYTLLDLEEGQIRHRKVKAGSGRAVPTAPKLSMWNRVSVCTEPVSDDLEWRKIDRPRDVDHLGMHYGYAWYRIEIHQDRAKKHQLFLPECEDRATVYLNGEILGVWGRGRDATRSPIPAGFRKGRNVLTLLTDNLGRANFGPRLGGRKGLYGHVYDAREIRTAKFRLRKSEGFSKRIIPRHLTHLVDQLRSLTMWEATAELTLTKVVPIHVSFTDLPAHVMLLCNDRVSGFFEGLRANYGDATLATSLKKGKNRIKLLMWGDVTPGALANVRLHMLNEPISAGGKWSVRPWQMPVEGGPVVGKDRPAWYVAKFKHPHAAEPLFLHVVGAGKGQLFLNGHNVGRFWTIGPQQYYYLPECWLREENELLVFEEHGNIPRRSRLEFRPLGPYSQ